VTHNESTDGESRRFSFVAEGWAASVLHASDPARYARGHIFTEALLMSELVEATNEPLTQDRLPWHKPAVLRLTVNLDTKVECGSGADGTDQTNLCIEI
jgi:hypothetical protein